MPTATTTKAPRMLQSRYGAKVVMGAADWESTLQRPASAPGGVPKRDIAVGPEGLKITLGDDDGRRDRHARPHAGHLVLSLPRQRRQSHVDGRLLREARRSTFRALAENFAIYRDSARKMAAAASAAGATVVMSNHTEFDRAWDRARIAQLPRAAGEKHPYEIGAESVQRYFEMMGDCAEAQRLAMN